MKLKERAQELAYQILKEAELNDDSEQGYIRVNADQLFQFYVLSNTKEKVKRKTYKISGYQRGELMFEETYIDESEVNELVEQFESEGYNCEVDHQ